MLPLLHLAWLCLTEQPVKMLYLAGTLAVVVAGWLVLSAFSSPSLLSNSSAIKSELVIVNARAINIPFPVRYIPRIRQIPGVDNMRWSTVAAFFCADGSGTTVTVTGWDGDHDDYLREKGASETDLETWHATENGVLVGPATAKQCGLTKGLTVSPDNIFGNGELPLQVVAVLPERGGANDTGVNAHYDYINRFLDGNIGTSWRNAVADAVVTVKNPSRLNQVAQTIEQEFQSSDPPLEAIALEDTASLLGRFGQVQALLLLIMGALALCTLLVFVGITAHLVAQRRASMAVLQTLGFNGQMQFFALLLELTGVVIAGTMLGIAGGHGLLLLLTPWATDTLFSGALHPADGAILVLPPALLLLLGITLIWPYLRISRLKPIDHLRF